MEIRTNVKRHKSKIFIMTITTILIIIVGMVIKKGMEFYKIYNNPSMIGKWTSLETGIEVEFTEEGIVNVEGVQTGAYIIKPPNLLVYDIEGYTFEMNYKINQRSLTWGLPGEEENFERKGI